MSDAEPDTPDPDYVNMREGLDSQECAVITDKDVVMFCGRVLGVISEAAYAQAYRPFKPKPAELYKNLPQALRAISSEAVRTQFWPNVYSVNERGNVTQLHPRTGKVLNSWV